MDELTFISKALYGVVSKTLGAEPIIDMRRMVMELMRAVDSVGNMNDEYNEEMIYSGSMAEGLRFASSDHDIMIVRRGIRAVFSSILSLAGNTRQTLFIAETDKTKPGFALLRLINQTSVDDQVTKSLVRYGSGYYLSSMLWVGSGHTARRHTSFTVHGPCLSGTHLNYEVDLAECISSESLPTPAYKNLLRLYQSGKIPYNELQNIGVKGCHFVAISSKRPVHEALEWRISFSFAEKTIIHSFNHTQFLCYGLLKIFLKEAIESNVELKGLLCSYFMKTAVFWLSLDRSLHWTPDNFLGCFLKCFKLLMEWVVSEYCPNFFIPANNMFADKFTRRQHTNLLTCLRDLYREGYQCLIRCPSISNVLFVITLQPRLADLIFSPLAYPSKSSIEIALICEIWNSLPPASSIHTQSPFMQYLDQHKCENRYQKTCLNIWKFKYLSEIALKRGLQGASNFLKTNSWYYRQYRETMSTLRTCEVDAASNLVYCAIYLYRLGRYKNVLQIVNKTKRRLQHPCIINSWNFNSEKYAAAGGETRPIIDMIRTLVALPVVLGTSTCIPDLLPEHLTGGSLFPIPPLICATFLGYLSHYRLGRFDVATSILQEFSTLPLSDDGYHIDEVLRALSWDMLGICQDMSGDYQEAYHSYVFALQQKWCPIKRAVLLRLISVLYRLMQSSDSSNSSSNR